MTAKEIREKVEKKRLEIKQESERLRREAKENHVCPNCGTKVSANRLYCSEVCNVKFFANHDYSQTSREIRDYKEELEYEFGIEHPRKEREPWSQLVAKKEHNCFVCGLLIPKGEKYDRYVRLPGIDEFFNDYPYESVSYHLSCSQFISNLYEAGAMNDEDYDENDLDFIFKALTREFGISPDEMRKRVRDGNGPAIEQIKAVKEIYSGDFESEPFGEPLFAESK